ncbi:MAG: DUF6382 domain-containing protein [Anaerovoracaceae bacterium]
MENKNKNFQMVVKGGVIKDYEKIVLSSGLCDLFMPMGFIQDNNVDRVAYDCSGYVSLSKCNITKIKEAFDILEKTFLILSKAGEYLISPSKITLNQDTIFYNSEKRQVKIAYVPMEEQPLSLRENMMEFICQVENVVEEENRIYLEKVRNHLNQHNYYIRDIINLIGRLKQQMYNGS